MIVSIFCHRCDEAGYFYVVDRLKELIKVKGLQVRSFAEKNISSISLQSLCNRKAQVAPAELENLVRSLDGVADCAVLGVPHPRAGQVFYLNSLGWIIMCSWGSFHMTRASWLTN